MQMEIGVWRIESAILTAIERVRRGGGGWLVTFESRWKRWQKYSPCPRSPICPRHGESILFRRTEAEWSCWNRSRSKLPASRMGGTSPLLFKLENFRTRFSPGLASERNRITCCIFVDRIERLESRVIKRISLPFPSISSNIPWKLSNFRSGKISRSRPGFEASSFIEGSSSLRMEGSRRAFFSAGFSVALLRQNV